MQKHPGTQYIFVVAITPRAKLQSGASAFVESQQRGLGSSLAKKVGAIRLPKSIASPELKSIVSPEYRRGGNQLGGVVVKRVPARYPGPY